MAPCVTLSPAWFVPVIVIVPAPVIAGFGKLPMLPFTVVAPVFIIPAPASTAKLPAVPNGTTTAAAWAVPPDTSRPPEETATAAATASTLKRHRRSTDAELDNFMIGSSSVLRKPPDPTAACVIA